jgi:hypothetical protein
MAQPQNRVSRKRAAPGVLPAWPFCLQLSTLRADRSFCRSTGDPGPPGSGWHIRRAGTAPRSAFQACPSGKAPSVSEMSQDVTEMGTIVKRGGRRCRFQPKRTPANSFRFPIRPWRNFLSYSDWSVPPDGLYGALAARLRLLFPVQRTGPLCWLSTDSALRKFVRVHIQPKTTIYLQASVTSFVSIDRPAHPGVLPWKLRSLKSVFFRDI